MIYQVALLLSAFVAYRLYVYSEKLKSVDYIKGPLVAFHPFYFPGFLFGSSRLTISRNFQWDQRLEFYKNFEQDVVSVVPFLSGGASVWSNSAEVMKQVASDKFQDKFIKDPLSVRLLNHFGDNVASMEGGEGWRRHRRIMTPAFNKELYELVCEEASRIYHDMIKSEDWLEKSGLEINAVQDFSYKFALMMVAACGFGTPTSWSTSSKDEYGNVSIYEAMRQMSETAMFLAAPAWVRKLPFKVFSDMQENKNALDNYIRAQISQRRKEIQEEMDLDREAGRKRRDVFSCLVRANEDIGEKYPLNESELSGNVYLLLLAGHETTGHTLAITLGFLALYQEEQKVVYDQIMEVVGSDRDPMYSDYSALDKVLAAFYEAGRLIPGGSVLFRCANEDTVIKVTKSDGSVSSHVIRKGTYVMADVIGVHYNPKVFDDPTSFRPSRWYKSKHENLDDSDASFLFSMGPRACLGRKFATTEAVVFLTNFIRDWHVDVVLLEGESREQWRDRVLQGELKLTLAAKSVPIRLSRR